MIAVEPVQARPREHVVAFDLLRSVAAVAVVVIHVVGPYRERIGVIPNAEWAIAVAFNGLSRWSVPVFIMITGALLLSDPRPFQLGHYVRRRVAKVLVPFLAWSVAYAVIAGASLEGFDATVTAERLRALPIHETYYHLGFFYYFIPLYLLVPLLRPLVRRAPPGIALAAVVVWLGLTTLYLAGERGFWSIDPVLFGGYLLFGWALWQRNFPPFALLVVAGVVALAIGVVMVVSRSLEAERYVIGAWFSYKSLHTAIAAGLVFALGLRLASRLPPRLVRVFGFVGTHSLGIYLLHPLFLWPVRTFDLYGPHPLLVIPFWTVMCGGLALVASVALRRLRVTAWLVP